MLVNPVNTSNTQVQIPLKVQYQHLQQENQKLKERIKELEFQLAVQSKSITI